MTEPYKSCCGGLSRHSLFAEPEERRADCEPGHTFETGGEAGTGRGQSGRKPEAKSRSIDERLAERAVKREGE
jgi:hypothetical protein